MLRKLISIVLPCHNEEKNIEIILPQIIKSIPQKYSYEIIFVDDGSNDLTPQKIIKLAKRNKRIKGIFFHRNFGHQAALRAGIQNASGKAIITMDSDMQHPPSVIPKFISLWEKGHDLVQAKKIEDQSQTLFMSVQRKLGYFIWSKITNGIIEPGISDFRLVDTNIAKYIKENYESDIFLRGIVTLGAKNPILVPYKVGKRIHGKSSYTYRMFLNMFINGFISFSSKPLRSASLLGIIIFAITLVAITVDIIRAIFVGKRIIEGWITVVAITMLLNSILMLYLGLLGEYIGVIFKEVKKRPYYLIERKINF